MINVNTKKGERHMEDSKSQNEKNYKELLLELAESHPYLARSLQKGNQNRVERLERLLPGVRLKGLEVFILHLSKIESVMQEQDGLKKIAFLIGRTRGDYEKALEAALAGMHSVVSDSMRDAMEIEFLLRDFLHEPTHVDEWLNASEETRYDRFRPAVLRHRHAQRQGCNTKDLCEYYDYKGHSMYLHVSPRPYPFGGNGIAEADDTFSADSCYWEMFEHARRLVFAIYDLVKKHCPQASYNPDPTSDLTELRSAWQNTQLMQSIYVDLVKASIEEGEAG